MKSYEETLIARKKADAECIAALFAESCSEGTNPYVQAEDGHWMTREEVISRMLNDYKTEDLLYENMG